MSILCHKALQSQDWPAVLWLARTDYTVSQCIHVCVIHNVSCVTKHCIFTNRLQWRYCGMIHWCVRKLQVSFRKSAANYRALLRKMQWMHCVMIHCSRLQWVFCVTKHCSQRTGPQSCDGLARTDYTVSQCIHVWHIVYIHILYDIYMRHRIFMTVYSCDCNAWWHRICHIVCHVCIL